jgi:hypothetical protein
MEFTIKSLGQLNDQVTPTVRVSSISWAWMKKTLFLDLNLRVNCAGTMVDGRENAASKIAPLRT